MPGKARDMHVAELREAKATAARASRARNSRKEEKMRERRLADKSRDMRIAELRDRKAPCAPRSPHAAVPSRASRTPALEGQAEAKTARQRTRAPGQNPRGLRRVGRARGQGAQGPECSGLVCLFCFVKYKIKSELLSDI